MVDVLDGQGLRLLWIDRILCAVSAEGGPIYMEHHLHLFGRAVQSKLPAKSLCQ